MRNPFKFYRSDYDYAVFTAYEKNNEDIVNQCAESGDMFPQEQDVYEWSCDGKWYDVAEKGRHSSAVQKFVDLYRSKSDTRGKLIGSRLVRKHKKKGITQTVAEFYRMDGSDTQGWIHQKLYHEHREMCYQLNWTIMFRDIMEMKKEKEISKDVPPRKVATVEAS